MYNTVFLDAGHGGINPDGKYTTAPSKMYTHKMPFNQSGDVVFYEGVKNRLYCNTLYKKLASAGVNVVKVYHDYEDVSLANRVNVANTYHNLISKGIYVSEHSNATSEGKARGFCAYTSRGNSTSDVLAQRFIENYKKEFPQYRILADMSDGDLDQEADFYVIKNTMMPAVLFENLFFDNLEDAKVLYDATYMQRYTDLQFDWIVESLRMLNQSK